MKGNIKRCITTRIKKIPTQKSEFFLIMRAFTDDEMFG